MNELLVMEPERIGLLIWLVWAVIGIVGGVVASRYMGPRTAVFCIVIGVVASVLGGYLSTCFIGGGAVQMFLLSVLGAVFSAAVVLWIVMSMTSYFRKNENQ